MGVLSTKSKKLGGGSPTGSVTAYAGDTVPYGWLLCDGTNGTPDLRNRFIYGGDGSNNGATGGEVSHTLTEAELPALSGSVTNVVVWNNGFAANGILGKTEKGTARFNSTANENNYNATINVNFGGDQPHNNMPPYHVLAWIMKL